MFASLPIITLKGDNQSVIARITQALMDAELEVIRSFDLRMALEAHIGCTCPLHGTDRCDCQMVVLLVYDQNRTPITIVAHGHDGETRLAFVEHPDQRPDPDLVNVIQHTLF